MTSKDDKENAMQEELRITPPEDVGAENEITKEEQEAIDALRKYTDEDADDVGEISIKSILGGDFLMSKFMLKQVMFVMFCVLLMLLYTGNRYSSQQDAILIDSLRGHLQDVKYNVLTQSSELMNMMRQSNVEKRLQSAGDSLLHNSITPPYLIKAGKETRRTDEEDIEEVLVDSTDAPAGTQRVQPSAPAGQAEAPQQAEEAGQNPETDKPKEEQEKPTQP